MIKLLGVQLEFLVGSLSVVDEKDLQLSTARHDFLLNGLQFRFFGCLSKNNDSNF